MSVVTVCLNCRDTIGPTLDSVFDQRYPAVESVVIDGASQDGTREYLESVRDRIAVLVSEPDRGIYDAMNKGLRAATGDYVIFVNGGDQLADPGVVERVMGHPQVASTRPPIIAGRVQLVHGGERLNLFRPRRPGPEGPGLPHQAVFVELAFHRQHEFDARYRYVGDYELWRRLQSIGRFDVLHLDDVVALFAVGGVTTGAGGGMRRYLERAYVDYLYSNRFGVKEWLMILAKPAIRRALYIAVGERMLTRGLGFARRRSRHEDGVSS